MNELFPKEDKPIDPILLEPYSPEWPLLFKELGQKMRQKL